MNKYVRTYLTSGENQPKCQGYKFLPELRVSGLLLSTQPRDPERPQCTADKQRKEWVESLSLGLLRDRVNGSQGGSFSKLSMKASGAGGKAAMPQALGAAQAHTWDYAAADEMERK